MLISLALVERILVRVVPAGSWLPMLKLALDCLVLALAGRAARSSAGWFLLTLAFWDLEDFVSLNLPWVARSAMNAWRYPQIYLESLFGTVATQGLLAACIVIGANANGPERPPSVLHTAGAYTKEPG